MNSRQSVELMLMNDNDTINVFPCHMVNTSWVDKKCPINNSEGMNYNLVQLLTPEEGFYVGEAVIEALSFIGDSEVCSSFYL